MATVDDLYDMSDEELEAAFKAAKADQINTEIDETVDTDTDTDSDDSVDTDSESDTEQNKDEDHEVDGDDQTSDTDDSEQPGDQDSDTGEGDTASSTTDGDVESDKDAQSTNADTVAAKTPTVRKFKANGKEYEFTQEEMETQFPKLFGQAMDYTKKMQAIAPWRKTIDAIEQAKLSHEDINLMIDALKGDKGAITEVLKRTGTDALELNPETATYTPKDYGRDSRALALQDVLDSIKNDQEYAITSRILSTDWDEASWNVLSSDPEKIRLLHNDVKSGLFAELQPIVEKKKVFDGNRQSDLDYYLIAAREYYAKRADFEAQQRVTATATARTEAEEAIKQRMAKAKAQEEQRKVAQKNSQARRSAATSAASVASSRTIDYLDASDEEFEEWYRRINS